MTKKQAKEMLKKELNEKPRFTPHNVDCFRHDDRYIIISGYVSRKNSDDEADLIIEHNGYEIIESFIEYL